MAYQNECIYLRNQKNLRSKLFCPGRNKYLDAEKDFLYGIFLFFQVWGLDVCS